jgi:hypothetical protein
MHEEQMPICVSRDKGALISHYDSLVKDGWWVKYGYEGVVLLPELHYMLNEKDIHHYMIEEILEVF